MSSVKPAVDATQFHAALKLCRSVVYLYLHLHLQPREKVLESGGQRRAEDSHPTGQRGSEEVTPELDSWDGDQAEGLRLEADTWGPREPGRRRKDPAATEKGGGGVRRGPQDDFIPKLVWGKLWPPPG